jgi:hypothetical protein
MTAHEWRPLGFRKSVAFLFGSGRMVASWRFVGWELEIEKNGRWPRSISLWRR